MNKDEWIFYEVSDIYDGWCLRFNPKTKEIVWRDAWFVDRLNQQKKDKVEQEVLKFLNDD